MAIFFQKLFRRRLKAKNEPGGDPKPCAALQYDSVKVTLPLLTISVTRKLNIDTPHELTVVVPRAEIRTGENGTELIYNSITVVHAPRHPLAGEQPAGGTSPASLKPRRESLPEALPPHDVTKKGPRINTMFNRDILR